MLNELKTAIGALRKIGAKKEASSFEELLAEEIRKLDKEEERGNKSVRKKTPEHVFKAERDFNDLFYRLMTEEPNEYENPDDNG